jgi:hypothetical protein
MTAIRFDRFNAISYANKLKMAGLESKIAEAISEEFSNIIDTQLATKEDLGKLKNEIIIKLGCIVISCTGFLGLCLGALGLFLKHY